MLPGTLAIPLSNSAGEDVAVAAVRAVVGATRQPLAVFDADGECVIANAAFVLQGALKPRSPGAARPEEQRTPFSPDGRRQWTLVSPTDPVASSTEADLVDAIAHALPVMFNAKDTQSRYLFMNRFQASLYHTTPEQAVGRTAGELVGAEYGEYTRNLDAEVIRTGLALPFFEEGPEPAGGPSRRWLTSKVPLTDAAGAVWGVATISIDISERTRLEQTLRRAKEEAEASSRAQSAFLAAMSHELRTPLNAVIGFAEIIRQQTLGPVGVPDYADYAEHILNSGRHLLSLINDILDYVRIESGGLRLTRAPVELRAMLRGMLEAIAPGAQAAGVRLVSDLGAEAVAIRADEMRLRQALANIAGNAVKFTPAGGQVTVTLRPGPEGGAVISIADSGIGIDEPNLARVFEPFWQADSGLDRLHEGMGIGLPLARRLVTLHGGRLELQSRLGKGTVVTTTLPAGEDE